MPKFSFGFKPDGLTFYDLSDAELASHVGTVPMRAAPFEYIGRDGGDIEGLGAGIESYSFTCFYTGEDYDKRLRAIRSAVQVSPKGLLTHPELGKIRAHCLGIPEYSVNYVTERETVNFRIDFKQDGTDQTKQGFELKTPTSLAAQLDQAMQKAAQIIGPLKAGITSIANLPTTLNVATLSVSTQLAAMQNFTSIFANSVVQASTLGLVDFTLDAQRQSVFASCENMNTALRQTGLPDSALYPALASVRVVYALTLDLDALARTQSPQVKTITIQGRQPIVVFAAQQYGGSAAIAKVAELTINNGVGSFGLTPGFSMRVVGATIDRGNGA